MNAGLSFSRTRRKRPKASGAAPAPGLNSRPARQLTLDVCGREIWSGPRKATVALTPRNSFFQGQDESLLGF